MARAALLIVMLAGCAVKQQGPARPGSGLVSAERATDVVSDSLLPLSDALAAEGYTPTAKIERGFLAPASRVTHPVLVPANTCLAIVSVATPSISDLDAGLYAADGSVLAEDDASDARPVVRICTARAPVRAYLALFAFQGTGSYAIARLSRPARADDALMASSEAVGSQPFLELVRGLRSRGYQDEGPTTELPLVAGSALRIASKVAAGQCYSVVADGERLRVRLLDEDGRQLALGVGEQGPAAFQYCASRSAELTLEVSGAGAARSAHLLRLRAAQASVGGARALWLGEPSTGTTGQARSAAKHDGCAALEQPIAGRLALAQGAVLELPVPASADRCELIEVLLHDGLARATVRVESAQGELLGEREVEGGSGVLHACGASQARRISALGRAGFGAISLARRRCAD